MKHQLFFVMLRILLLHKIPQHVLNDLLFHVLSTFLNTLPNLLFPVRYLFGDCCRKVHHLVRKLKLETLLTLHFALHHFEKISF